MRASTILFVTILFSNSLCAEDHDHNFPPVGELPVMEFLPDPFIMEDGSRVKAPADWKKHREYLKAMIQHYMYGLPSAANVQSKDAILQ